MHLTPANLNSFSKLHTGFTLDKKRGKCFTKTKLAGRKKESGYTSGICMAGKFSYKGRNKFGQLIDASFRPIFST